MNKMKGSPVAAALWAAPLRLTILTLALMINACSPSPETAPIVVPAPVLRPTAKLTYIEDNKNWIRYEYEVVNRADFPAELFAPAPDLPPCGVNTNSSRSWLDFYGQDGTRLYGFCALGTPAGLGKIWFAVEESAPRPISVFIEIEDRKTKTKYKSNLAPVMP
jgi:hypothetical protein